MVQTSADDKRLHRRTASWLGKSGPVFCVLMQYGIFVYNGTRGRPAHRDLSLSDKPLSQVRQHA